jgi:hypothetical protein
MTATQHTGTATVVHDSLAARHANAVRTYVDYRYAPLRLSFRSLRTRTHARARDTSKHLGNSVTVRSGA